MARITIFGDFKVNQTKHLNLSGELMSLLNNSDIKVVNFEAPIKSKARPIKKSGPNICQHIESPDWLEDRGFNVISIANNHTMDFGTEGMEITKKAFKKAYVIGAGTWDEAYRMEVVETEDSKRIGFIACTHCEFGTLTDREGRGCTWAMSPRINTLIQEGKDKVDALVIIPHGGVEYMDVPLPEWRELYKSWIDLGADAVIGSHPHVPQGYEWYKGKPICYSLGNFCFSQLNKNKSAPDHWFESLCCILSIEKPHEIKMDIRPLLFDPKAEYISDNNNEEFKQHFNKMYDVLHNDTAYIEEVNREVKKRLPFYLGQFSRGGWVTNVCSKGFLKGFVEGIIGRGFFCQNHALNNMQCESHRWAILRALKLKQKG